MNIQLLLFSKEVGRLGERGEWGGGTGERKAGEFGSFPISFPVFILLSYILFWSCIESFPLKICNPLFLVFPSSFFLGGGVRGGGLSGRGGAVFALSTFKGNYVKFFC